jgi:hypothetical protein
MSTPTEGDTVNRRNRTTVTTFYPTGPKPRRRVFDELDLIESLS